MKGKRGEAGKMASEMEKLLNKNLYHFPKRYRFHIIFYDNTK